MKKKVIVIGLDGATLTLLKPWVQQGKLPNMANIMQEGSSGYLESTPEKLSPAAWTSFSTGSNPGKHGIFHFYTIEAGTLKVRINNSTHRKADPFWNQVGRAGKRVCIVNVPTTYPADSVNGYMVSGWDAPSIQSDGFTYPPKLINEILDKFHDYPLVPSIKKFTINQPEFAIKDLHRVLDLRISLSKYLLKKESWDLFTTVITETDQIQHFFWHLTDKTHPMFNQKLSDKYGDAILGIYKKCDQFIGDVMKDLGDDASIIIVSDHGAGINCLGTQYLPVLIERAGLLRKRTTSDSSWLKHLTMTLKRRIYNNLGSIIGYDLRQTIKKMLGIKQSGFEIKSTLDMSSYDWANTKVYPAGSNLRINLKGREAFGIVSAGREYDEVADSVISMLKRCVDLKTGRLILKDIIKKEDAYKGPYLDDAPDLILKWVDDFVISGVSCKMENGTQFKIPTLAVETEWTGEHSDYGIVMAKGGEIKAGYNVHASITDIAPSILYMMGLPVPGDMDGRVLTNIFKEEFLKENQIETSDASNDTKALERDYSAEEEKEIEGRLKDLGYL